MQTKKVPLKQRCIYTMEQNHLINPIFDGVALSHKETKAEFSNREIVNRNYGTEEIKRSKFLQGYHEFLFSLLEDIHRYTYLATCEIFLYEERLEQKQDQSFFSSQYFLANATHHIVGVWERTLKLCGLIYGYNFENSSSKYMNIYRALKKNEFFSESSVYKIIQELVDKNNLSTIDAFRIGNDHELSIHVKHEKDEDLKKTAEACFSNVKALYEIIFIFANRVQNECFVRFDQLDLSRFRWNIQIDDEKITSNVSEELKGKLISRLEGSYESISSIISKSIKAGPKFEPYLKKLDDTSRHILQHTDPIFRLHEAINSLRYACSLIARANRTGKELDETIVYFNNVNYTYFIESSIIRIYSVLDKLAILLHGYTGVGKKGTFEQFMRSYSGQTGISSNLLARALAIYETNEYKELNRLRQDNFHHIVKENYIHEVDSEWSHINNMIIASKIADLLHPLLSELFDTLEKKLLSGYKA